MNKPKIYKSRGNDYWICHGGTMQGYGDCADQAYRHWKNAMIQVATTNREMWRHVWNPCSNNTVEGIIFGN
jgi:hypothetical protein